VVFLKLQDNTHESRDFLSQDDIYYYDPLIVSSSEVPGDSHDVYLN
jgi:hypothetical protein